MPWNPAVAAGLIAALALAIAPRPAGAGDCSPTPPNPEGPFNLPGDPHLERDSLAVPSLVGVLSAHPDGPATLFFDFVLQTGGKKP